MSFRRAAGTVARRWLAGGEVSSGGAGRFGSGGHDNAAGRVARFWSFGGSKGDGEDGGEDGAKGDRDAGKVSPRLLLRLKRETPPNVRKRERPRRVSPRRPIV
jgi:hypothetical protein